MRLVFDAYREDSGRPIRELRSEVAGTLLAFAAHAKDDYGRGMYPSAATVASMIGKSPRQVQRDIDWLTRNGYLVRATDQAAAKRYSLPGLQAPVVYDLGMADQAEREVTQDQEGVSPARLRVLCAERRKGVDHADSELDVLSATQFEEFLTNKSELDG